MLEAWGLVAEANVALRRARSPIRLVAPAVRYKGRVYRGDSHPEVAMLIHFGKKVDYIKGMADSGFADWYVRVIESPQWEEGFVDSRGRFLDRKQALGLAQRTGQAPYQSGEELASEYLVRESAVERARAILERYGGAKKERGIWYHGTSPRHFESIMKHGLVPNPQQRAWSADDDAGFHQVSRVSYGGVYVTRNLVTATSSANNHKTANRGSRGELVVVMELQPRALVGDEDSFTGRTETIQPKGLIPNPPHVIMDLWMQHVAGWTDQFYRETVDKYVEDTLLTLSFKLPSLKNPGPLRSRVESMLRERGFLAALTRMASHLHEPIGQFWQSKWNASYARARRHKAWTEQEDIDATVLDRIERDAYDAAPPKPTPEEGERVFREFNDQLTRTLKHVAREANRDPFVHARSLEPIRFKGRNRIVCIVEIRRPSNRERAEAKRLWRANGKKPRWYDTFSVVEVRHGRMPQRFVADYKESIGDLMFAVENGKVRMV